MEHIIVVGAGTAGCIVAARLTECPDIRVTLLEAGPDTPLASLPNLTSVNWLDALEEADAFYSDLYAEKLENDPARPYRRGTGVGGSATTNAMLAVPGVPEDYRAWVEDFGLDEWSWEHVRPWFELLKEDLVVSADEELTPVDRALIEAGSALDLPEDIDTYEPVDGSGRLWRNARDGKRYSSREAYLEPARPRPNLRVLDRSQVHSLELRDGRATGVRLGDGRILEADRVVLCAGAFETPSILLRTGLDLPGIGKGLQDHPAASVYFSMREPYREADRSIPAIGAVLRCSSSVREHDINLLPLHGTLLHPGPANHGLIMAALMRVTSTGYLELDPEDPMKPPVVYERMLSTEEDRTAMRDAMRALERVLEAPSFRRIVDEVFVDEIGTPLDRLRDEEFFEQWLSTYVGDYFHAVGTARMGGEGDEGAVVDQRGRIHGLENAHVFDASIMPLVPSANSNLPTAMIAERLTAALREELDR
ncbi:GMC family oxidoreductase [Gulosibacter sp. 10]|uniref:GMC family oxidoreductase n=1 Tax=Gulosibacter sp. 10 TaxID=1255570 RepID=UPI00097F47B4|nr:GMC family oxidoreductase N-terminal domain-containing protein [Gulosibacter sp. 10]SJM60322.1 Choline dehydrogenase [Gulosibacter sp. 10]